MLLADNYSMLGEKRTIIKYLFGGKNKYFFVAGNKYLILPQSTNMLAADQIALFSKKNDISEYTRIVFFRAADIKCLIFLSFTSNKHSIHLAFIIVVELWRCKELDTCEKVNAKCFLTVPIIGQQQIQIRDIFTQSPILLVSRYWSVPFVDMNLKGNALVNFYCLSFDLVEDRGIWAGLAECQ